MTDKRRLPDPQELAIFLEVAKQKSFSQAALRLGVTTSSVSQSVTHLEKSLDATLVTGPTVRLSSRGQATGFSGRADRFSRNSKKRCAASNRPRGFIRKCVSGSRNP